MQSLNAVSYAIFQVYVAMLNRMRKSASSQITRINETYEKIKKSNQADIVPPNWSLPLSESEIVLTRCYGLLNDEPVDASWDGTLSFEITNGANYIDIAVELVATYPRLLPPAYGASPAVKIWAHPDGVVVRIDAADYTVGATYRKGLLVYLDASLAIDNVVELWSTDATWKSAPDNFRQVVACMSIEGTAQFIVYDRAAALKGAAPLDQFSTMTFDGTSYKYSQGINWTYDGESYSMRNGFVYKDNTAIYTGIMPSCTVPEIANNPWDYANNPLFPLFVQFDGTFLYWGLKTYFFRSSGTNNLGQNSYIKRIEVA